MVILHFACIDNSKTSGVCVAVLKHVQTQGMFAQTALINVNGVEIRDSVTQLPFSTPFRTEALPEPFARPDLAVFHECYRPAYLHIAEKCRKNNIPYIIIPHGELREEAQRKKHLKKAAANFLLFNRFINHAAAIQCLSGGEMNATHFGTIKFVGTNGVEIPAIRKESFRSDGAVFLFIGRYEWRAKGLDLMLDAIETEKTFLRENRCRFVLYGPDINGRFATVTAMVKDRKIGDLVSLHREILGADKEAALIDADIFIQTSRHEGMPIGILEAMSYGLPCLVTKGTSLGDEIASEHAGWAAETTAQDISKRIVEAVNERDKWAELGENAGNAVRKRYSWNTISKNTIEQYQVILNSINNDQR